MRDGVKVRPLEEQFLSFTATRLARSKSQLFQDLFVLWVLGDPRTGYFVEFGATDGVLRSNSWLLEQSGWTGILAEPARGWHEALSKNRTALIEHECVWSRTGESSRFRETPDRELSTIVNFVDGDAHAVARSVGETYEVKTVSLVDLLARHSAPEVIDYLSIDTEGSELEILGAHDFDRYHFRVMTVEHNYTSKRERIYELLSKRGYVRVLSTLSEFDDWYVDRELAVKLLAEIDSAKA